MSTLWNWLKFSVIMTDLPACMKFTNVARFPKRRRKNWWMRRRGTKWFRLSFHIPSHQSLISSLSLSVRLILSNLTFIVLQSLLCSWGVFGRFYISANDFSDSKIDEWSAFYPILVYQIRRCTWWLGFSLSGGASWRLPSWQAEPRLAWNFGAVHPVRLLAKIFFLR